MQKFSLSILFFVLGINTAVSQLSPDVRDAVYAVEDGVELKLDLYFPSGSGVAVPVVVWIHGGGWRTGDKTPLPAHAAGLVTRGYAVAGIQYRLSHQAIFPAQIHDCWGAIRWLRENAAIHSLDPDRIGVWGSSAGGHLVALLGTSAGVDSIEGVVGGRTTHAGAVQAVCDWYGPTDFLQFGGSVNNPGSAVSLLLGGPPNENRDKARAANPITHITADDPPFLIMHGTEDGTVPIGQSELLADALQNAGVEHTFIRIPGAGHGGALFREDSVRNRVYAFFDRHLRSPTEVIETQNVLPASFVLHTNYPNPFGTGSIAGSPSTTITLDVLQAYSGAVVRLDILDIRGTLVQRLSNRSLEAGHYHFQFSAQGRRSGFYLCRLITGNFVQSVSMILMK